VCVRQREQAARERCQPGIVGLWQRQRQREGQRPGAAGGQVAEVHRQRLVAQPVRIGIREEMPAGHQHVGRDREPASGRRLQHRAVIADADDGAARRAPEVACDQVELAARLHRRQARGSMQAPRPRGPATGNPADAGACRCQIAWRMRERSSAPTLWDSRANRNAQ
jgi:hypothetical protein